ncbi:MAG: saccharopine dehydrogenase NADP-binding domain-containing protein [Gemmatimonadota bacterium]
MLLIYGANGYTGRLIVDECVRRGLRPIIAARRADALAELAEQYGLESRVFPLTSPDVLASNLDGVRVVLHAAGPFFRTSAAMVTACLVRQVHYLDVTGEIVVFEACKARDAEARSRGIVVLPGVGFDVVPTDCLAAQLATRLPDTSLLELAFAGGGVFSRGTLKTMVLGLNDGGAVRQDGRITRVPTAWRTQRIAFRDRPRSGVTIPWGDVSTAHWSTGIPNIHTYIALPPDARKSLRMVGFVKPMLRLDLVRALVERLIDARVTGPSAEVRATARMHIWGRVTHLDGRVVSGTAETPEGYRLTALSAAESAVRLLDAPPAPGYHTPSTAFGADFLTTLPECSMQLGDITTP